MNFLSRGLASSFLVHAAVVVVFAGLGLTATAPAPLVIDFTLQQGGQQQAAPKDVQENKLEQRTPQRHVVSRKIRTPVPEQPQHPEPVAEALSGNTEQAVPVATAPVKEQVDKSSGSTAHASVDASLGDTGKQEVASSRGVGAGSGEGYARANYSYIRDMVQKMLEYPAIARRKGWQGKVIISFIVCADGYVRDVSVTEGSGIELLDRNAVQAVMKAIPFPRPPAEARLIIPVAYVLN